MMLSFLLNALPFSTMDLDGVCEQLAVCDEDGWRSEILGVQSI